MVKIVKNSDNGRLNILNDSVLNVLKMSYSQNSFALVHLTDITTAHKKHGHY